MSLSLNSLLKVFKLLHIVGLMGLAILFATDLGQTVNGMVVISSLLGLGGVMISPFPVAIFIQWASDSKQKDL
ncbi:hypothetical protein MD588_13895 [Photobacterium sp. SDRW27]|uniref:hypothetical protein n=1 Tax=Photobacterium obscurum TaxID=2829490 RepID=UPI00224496BB|nr:hypothetical protein [Photobacterium obscurum]MCW8329898.1 hypothetical protein [Photobacterium obscurum]